MVKSFKLLPLPARRKPSSSHGRYSCMAPGTKPIGSQPSAISAVSLTIASPPAAREVGIHVQDRLQRLGEARGALALVGQADLATFVRHGAFALENLAHDRDVILDPIVGLAPRLAVPALDDLRSGDTEACDEAAATGPRVNAGRRH